jgi:hypothetical protein
MARPRQPEAPIDDPLSPRIKFLARSMLSGFHRWLLNWREYSRFPAFSQGY